MRNINELMPCKVINFDNIKAHVDSAIDGSFEHLYNKACKKELNVIVDNAGNIIGGEYVSGKTGAEDAAAQVVFQAKYAGKPLCDWLVLAVQLSTRNDIEYIVEDSSCVKAVLNDGEVEVVYGTNSGDESSDEFYDEEDEEDFDDFDVEDDGTRTYYIPTDVLAPYDEDDLENEIKRFIRASSGHYLEKGRKIDIDYDEDEEVFIVRNVKLGRKI